MTKPAKGVDIDALLAANVRKRPGTRCAVCHALAKMDDATRDRLAPAMADTEQWSHTGMTAVFVALGHDVGRSSVERHRRGECMANRGNA